MNVVKGILFLIILLLVGCSNVQQIQKPVSDPQTKLSESIPLSEKELIDGPPTHDQDVSFTPNAIPKVEPLSRYGNPAVYEVLGKRYKVMDKEKSQGYTEKGVASWYGRKFHGQRTSSGEPFDMFAMTAAHRSLPLPTYAKVTNLKNGKEVVVKINDRGPFVKNRLIDLSYAAAKKLGFHDDGTTHVHVATIDPIAWQKEHAKQIYLQVGAFNKKLSAEELAKEATLMISKNSHSYKVDILPEKIDNKSLYKVRIGPIEDKTKAEKLQKQLLAKSALSPTVIYD